MLISDFKPQQFFFFFHLAQPMHWIYDQGKMKTLTDGVEEIEFRNPSANPFYRIETGRNTGYGDQAYCVLKSLVACKGGFIYK